MVTMTRFLAVPFAVLLLAPETTLAETKEEQAKRYLADLGSKDVKVRLTAMEELGKLGQIRASYGRPAIPMLLEGLKDKDARIRAAAALALGRVDPEADQAVEPLLALVKNDKEELAVRRSAILGLAAMGEKARGAVPALRALQMNRDMSRESQQLRQAARQAIQAIQPRRGP
jgi:HEAT repeat protein